MDFCERRTSLTAVLFLSGLTSLVVAMIKSSNYQMVTLSNGDKACSTKGPTKIMSLTSNRIINKKLKCGSECTSASNCLLYQYRQDLKMCELYDFWPAKFSPASDCIGFRDAGELIQHLNNLKQRLQMSNMFEILWLNSVNLFMTLSNQIHGWFIDYLQTCAQRPKIHVHTCIFVYL